MCDMCMGESKDLGSGFVKVFVYGTLMQGYSNHYQYMHNARFIDRAKTKNKYYRTGLISVYEKPPIGETKAEQIYGELYAVPITDLPKIDMLEGHPRVYRRKLITVIDSKGTEHEAYIYFLNTH